ncbi:DegT/DnrJ/EryC1/StrS family aminotransferase [Nitrosococcus watsonii]|uniref:DegT/DnrJ/EryC1/StrS aminotransferase n=1 Tax=Nitrosococcus watsoni (strain C-113) TaxID=105559 RepID=D8KBF1_NITWC|nr:DegT/DnrJ/EryC1/StrS family aminotransferase [Nitrosococcus watsonii]ADJ29598.1 DegT/DnrJ/EryC1/StrS aminotransferase [Nitrosococcus watsonii C-113]
MNQPMLALGDPVLGEEEKTALCAVIDSGWLTMGDRVGAFEQAFADLHGVASAVAVNSCTAALHLCLCAFDIGPGDEVLVPAITFVATANAVIYVGATPVFVDVEGPERPHLSLQDAAEKCTDKTRAVIVMHYGGYPVDLPAWREFADERGLILIEDAAHSPAIEEVGHWGDGSAFSFFSNKNMTTAEGGMVLSPSPEVLARVRQLRSHGMTATTIERHRGHAYSYDVTALGYNYRLDELRAAIGLVQLARLPAWTTRRRRLTDSYRRFFSELLPEVHFPFAAEEHTAAHILPVLLPDDADRQNIMAALRAQGIQSSIHYPPIHHFAYYRKRFPSTVLPNSDAFFSRELTLPLHPRMTEEEVERVVKALQKALREEKHDL